MAATARHETRALLRAHLSAASGHPHKTKHCPICHRLLRLASASDQDPYPDLYQDPYTDPYTDPQDATEAPAEDIEGATEDQTPSPA